MSELPERPIAHVNCTKAENWFRYVMPPEWVLHKIPGDEDYGIDFDVDVFEGGFATGERFHVQLKAREKARVERGFVEDRCKVRSLNLWLYGRSDPTLYIVYEVTTDRAWWEDVRKYVATDLSKTNPNWHTQKSARFRLPTENIFDKRTPYLIIEYLRPIFEKAKRYRQELLQLHTRTAGPFDRVRIEAERAEVEMVATVTEQMLSLPGVWASKQVLDVDVFGSWRNAPPLHFFFLPSEGIVIEFPDGSWGVVDAGRRRSKNMTTVHDFLKYREASDLRFVCATHPHYDHIGGIPDVLASPDFRIREFWDSGVVPQNRVSLQLYSQVLQQSKQGAIVYRRLSAEDHLFAGSVSVRSLSPSNDLIAKTLLAAGTLDHGKRHVPNLNLLSTVLFIEYGLGRALLGSDMPAQGWRHIINTANRLHRQMSANIVHVPHSGASHANPEFLWDELSKDRSPVAIYTPNPMHKLPSLKTIHLLRTRGIALAEVSDNVLRVALYPDGRTNVSELKL